MLGQLPAEKGQRGRRGGLHLLPLPRGHFEPLVEPDPLGLEFAVHLLEEGLELLADQPVVVQSPVLPGEVGEVLLEGGQLGLVGVVETRLVSPLFPDKR